MAPSCSGCSSHIVGDRSWTAVALIGVMLVSGGGCGDDEAPSGQQPVAGRPVTATDGSVSGGTGAAGSIGGASAAGAGAGANAMSGTGARTATGMGAGGRDSGVPDASTPAIACAPQTIALRSSAGKSLVRDYAITTRAVFDMATSHNLPQWGTLKLSWSAELSVGERADVTGFDWVPARDDTEFPGSALCGAGGTTYRDAALYMHTSIRLAEVACPGEAVDGTVRLAMTGATGTIAGVAVAGSVDWFQVAPGWVRASWNDARIEIDDSGADSPSGAVLGGWFRAEDGRYYCVAGGTYARPDRADPEAMQLSLTGLSRVAPCAMLPERATLDVCIADEWQSERP